MNTARKEHITTALVATCLAMLGGWLYTSTSHGVHVTGIVLFGIASFTAAEQIIAAIYGKEVIEAFLVNTERRFAPHRWMLFATFSAFLAIIVCTTGNVIYVIPMLMWADMSLSAKHEQNMYLARFVRFLFSKKSKDDTPTDAE